MIKKLLTLLLMIWRFISHEITLWIMLIGSSLVLGGIIAHGCFQPGPLESNIPGVGKCLTMIVATFVIAYIRDMINMFAKEEGGDKNGDV